jgi:hypothetical protein
VYLCIPGTSGWYAPENLPKQASRQAALGKVAFAIASHVRSEGPAGDPMASRDLYLARGNPDG